MLLQAADQTSLSIADLSIGQAGPFAMTMWFQQSTNAGADFQYLISGRNPSLPPITNDTVFYPNQVIQHCNRHRHWACRSWHCAAWCESASEVRTLLQRAGHLWLPLPLHAMTGLAAMQCTASSAWASLHKARVLSLVLVPGQSVHGPQSSLPACAQVHVYLPEADHPSKGTVRAVVEGSQDSYLGIQSHVFLDSGEQPCWAEAAASVAEPVLEHDYFAIFLGWKHHTSQPGLASAASRMHVPGIAQECMTKPLAPCAAACMHAASTPLA